jgi:hypothetical protein
MSRVTLFADTTLNLSVLWNNSHTFELFNSDALQFPAQNGVLDIRTSFGPGGAVPTFEQARDVAYGMMAEFVHEMGE